MVNEIYVCEPEAGRPLATATATALRHCATPVSCDQPRTTHSHFRRPWTPSVSVQCPSVCFPQGFSTFNFDNWKTKTSQGFFKISESGHSHSIFADVVDEADFQQFTNVCLSLKGMEVAPDLVWAM